MAAEVQHCFPPVVSAATRILVLGSLPGAMSLAAARYYANPRNQFWRLMEEVLEQPLADCPYEQRLARLLARGVGLWDTVAAARRTGSLDAAIRLDQASDVAALAAGLPALQAIAFNGGTAARIGRRAIGDAPRMPGSAELLDLPSSSPAYTLPFAAKAKAWRVLRRYRLPA